MIDRRVVRVLSLVLVSMLAIAPAAGEEPDPMPAHDPVATPAAIVEAGPARFTVLTPRLIRMEWSPASRFEDRASQPFINRRLVPPAFEVARVGGQLTISTDQVRLTYAGTGRFDETNLSVELTVAGEPVVWRPGADASGNLLGTYRTLDGVSGRTSLEPGLVSREGWALVDDSETLVFEGEDWPWLTPRDAADGTIDWYLFAHGHDFAGALQDFTLVAGRIPVPPKYVLGSWFSRYWPYTDEEYKQIVGEYREHDVGLDVLVLDMDWHLDGWTGYTWNPKYFPDPDGFLDWARDQGLRTTLNLHPADGVGKHEAAFNEMRAAMGGGKTTYRVPFDCADPRYMRAYFDILHHPLEEQGVDFWWMDWQQGTESGIPGLDPLWWLNHLHWEDMETNPARAGKRPLVFSRWGGLGNHRYPIGFSGDTFNDWASLAFQPFFTATAANVGYAYWSHDIGGHQPGPVEDELYTRWVQYGVFSPILRVHSGRHPGADRRIWTFRDDCFEAMREAFQLRYRLVPMLYTAARRAHDEAIAPFRPLYWEWPDLDEAYERTGQYLFGDQMMIAPVTAPVDELSGLAPIEVWIPPGSWTEWNTGRTHEGPTVTRLAVPLDEIPVFVRSGGIVVEAPDALTTMERPFDDVTVTIYPGERGEFELYEDDGLSTAYLRSGSARTLIEHETWPRGTHVIRIHATEGTFDGMVESRSWTIRRSDSEPPDTVEVNGRRLEMIDPGGGEGWWYDAESLAVVVRIPEVDVRRRIEVRIEPSSTDLLALALRRGLRGQLAQLDAIAELIGDDTRAFISSVRSIRDRIAESPRESARIAERLQESAHTILTDIVSRSQNEQERARITAMLLGLSSAVEIEPAVAPGGRVAIDARASSAPRFDSMREVAVRVTLAPGEGWRIAEGHARDADMVASDTPLATRWLLEPAAPGLGTPTGQADVELRFFTPGGEISHRETVAWGSSIAAWSVVGPFPAPFRQQPASEPAHNDLLDPAQPVAEGESTLAWRRIDLPLATGADPNAELRVDLNDLLDGPHEHALAYAVTTVVSPDDRPATLAIASDDSVRAWLNGDLVHDHHVARAYRSKQDLVPVRLRKGENRLVVRIGQQLGGWEFSVHVLDPDGRPSPGVYAIRPAAPG